MKSIRLSLIVYFLLLIVLTLGAVLGLLYQTTVQTLEAKETTTRELLDKDYEARCRVVRERFDQQLLHRALSLATLVRYQYQVTLRPRKLYPLGILTAALNPHGYVLTPLWLAEGIDRQFARDLMMHSDSRIWLPPEIAAHEDDGRGGDFFQICSEDGEIMQQSPTLKGKTLPLTGEVRRGLGVLDSHFDDDEVAGIPVRFVTLKVPVTRVTVVPSTRPPVRRKPQPGALPRRPEDHVTPALFIQWAAGTAERDAALQFYRDELIQQQASQQAQSTATMEKLRNRLVWIGVATFITVMAGACWLIGVGLASLHRLSEAVSNVSERDFRLKFDPQHLPVELRPIFDRLTRTLDQLGRAFAREKQAAADISHELRTPLAAMLTTIEVALHKPRTPEKYQEFLVECREIGRQMTRMVERLLLLARMDSGVDAVRPQEVDVGDVAEQCVALVRPLAEARGLKVTLRHAPGTELRTDPDKLREVLNNLLHNAIDYNRPYGKIDVQVERQNGHVEVDVRDTGIGITPEACTRIFERFYRADSSRQAESIHAGVGLSIVKGYVDLMGGTVSVHSKPGEGSTFQVRLPVH